MSDKGLIDLALHLHHETEKAYLVSDTGDNDDTVWVPKSQCELNERKGGGVCEFTLPAWLAHGKGLI
jgi:hypothetical protein